MRVAVAPLEYKRPKGGVLLSEEGVSSMIVKPVANILFLEKILLLTFVFLDIILNLALILQPSLRHLIAGFKIKAF
jgi:hypothetical protein